MSHILRRVHKHATGKIRRFLLLRFRQNYVTEQIELRQGECNQCGNCCEILFKCPFLIKNETGGTLCSIYENRPKQCDAFPIDEKCLSDVNFDCTYTFGKPPAILTIEPELHPADH